MQMSDEKLAKLKKLADKKARIEQQEKLIKEKERKIKTRRYIQVGILASKFGIDTFDDLVLAGAFAEMEESSKDSATLNKWKKKGESLSKTNLHPLILSFGKELDDEAKKRLKSQGFKWNSFRNEWQGYGIKEEITKLAEKFDGTVEAVGS